MKKQSLNVFCEDQCKVMTEKVQRTHLSMENDEANFIVVILSRGVQTNDGFQFSENIVNATEDISFR